MDVPWSRVIGITDPDPDHPKETHPRNYCFVTFRVPPRIYRLGEKKNATSFLGGLRVLPPESVLNEYALRYSLVHFETQSCNIVYLHREYLLHVY